MINGMIKLFYSEIVKTKMKQMKQVEEDDEIELKDEFRMVREITFRIDSIFFRVLKIIGICFLTIIGFNINIFLGIGILLTSMFYLIYKIRIEEYFLEYIEEVVEDIEYNIRVNRLYKIREKITSKLSILISLLVLGIILDFNIFIIFSFVVVCIFTIRDMYSNIR